MIVDIFAHHLSRSIGPILAREKYYGPGRQNDYHLNNADAEFRLGLMDDFGIDVQALSQTTPVLLGFNAEDAAEICRLSNDSNFALCKAYPKRFVNVCMVSLLDVPSALHEIDRAMAELDCRAITIATNQNGRGLGDPEYYPFYDKLMKYDLPLLLQPTHWESYPLVDFENSWRSMLVFGWPFDTTQALWRMIFGGIFDRYPSLKVVTHHCGAMFPYFVKRIEKVAGWALKDQLPRPITEYWGNLYGDTVLDGAVPALMCGYSFFGPERMLFGTDYPFSGNEGRDCITANLAGVQGMDIPAEASRKILGENACKLLRIS